MSRALGAVLTLEGQFPLPGFNVAKWNSVESPSSKPNEAQVFVQRNSAIIGYEAEDNRKFSGRSVTNIFVASIKTTSWKYRHEPLLEDTAGYLSRTNPKEKNAAMLTHGCRKRHSEVVEQVRYV